VNVEVGRLHLLERLEHVAEDFRTRENALEFDFQGLASSRVSQFHLISDSPIESNSGSDYSIGKRALSISN
jgi:hypothetical protein